MLRPTGLSLEEAAALASAVRAAEEGSGRGTALVVVNGETGQRRYGVLVTRWVWGCADRLVGTAAEAAAFLDGRDRAEEEDG